MSKEINQYTAASTIDAVNDQLLIDPGGTGAYNKINRNTLLGITGAPLGSSDTQTLTNKTIGNTNTIVAQDANFTLQDNGDNTKQAQFQLSGNTTGTTRTYSLPNASVTLASLTGTETLTNKTITSPTITGGTIDNATVTVDSIAGHSTSTIVTVANLQISNGVLNSANAVTATSIAAGAVQPNALTTGTGTGWAWSSWTPTWTTIVIGNGVVTARYIQMGKTVFGFISVVLGSTSSVGSGTITFTAPVAVSSSWNTAGATPQIGTARNNGNGANFADIPIRAESTTILDFIVPTSSGAVVGEATFSSTVPSTWTTGNSIAGTFMYEAA